MYFTNLLTVASMLQHCWLGRNIIQPVKTCSKYPQVFFCGPSPAWCNCGKHCHHHQQQHTLFNGRFPGESRVLQENLWEQLAHVFHRQSVFPVSQPTPSKHWRKHWSPVCENDPLVSPFLGPPQQRLVKNLTVVVLCYSLVSYDWLTGYWIKTHQITAATH